MDCLKKWNSKKLIFGHSKIFRLKLDTFWIMRKSKTMTVNNCICEKSSDLQLSIQINVVLTSLACRLDLWLISANGRDNRKKEVVLGYW